MVEIVECVFIYLFEQHFLLFLVLFILQVIHYLLVKKYDEKNVQGFFMMRKNEWIVIFITFLLVYLLNLASELVNDTISVTTMFSWSIVILFIIKEMNNILILIKEKGSYVPDILLKTLDSVEDKIEGEDDESNSN